MPISCKQIAEVADGLYLSSDEAPQRSAVSRSFYAAFHRCGEWRDALPGAASIGGYAGGTHQQLLNQLRAADRTCTDEQKKRGRFMATKLEVLRQRRVLADYSLADTFAAGEISIQQVQGAALIGECDANP